MNIKGNTFDTLYTSYMYIYINKRKQNTQSEVLQEIFMNHNTF